MWKRNNFSRHRCEKLTELDSHRQDAIIFFSEENTKAIGVLHFVICNALWLNYSLKLCPYDPPYLLFKTQICKNFNKSPSIIRMICLQAILATGFGASERYFPTGTYVLTSQLWNKEKILASQIFLHFLLFWNVSVFSTIVSVCHVKRSK